MPLPDRASSIFATIDTIIQVKCFSSDNQWHASLTLSQMDQSCIIFWLTPVGFSCEGTRSCHEWVKEKLHFELNQSLSRSQKLSTQLGKTQEKSNFHYLISDIFLGICFMLPLRVQQLFHTIKYNVFPVISPQGSIFFCVRLDLGLFGRGW